MILLEHRSATKEIGDVCTQANLKLKREVSRTERRFKIAIMFLGRRRRSREESPEWICESRCRQVSVRLHVFAGFFCP